MSRGWASSVDAGINTNYYLYVEIPQRMFSPYGLWFTDFSAMLIVDKKGQVGNGYVNDQNGGVQFIELCYRFNLCRGYISEENSGSNESYYLLNGAWYRMLSSFCFEADKHVKVFYVSGDGYIGHNWVNSEASGVQSFTKKETFFIKCFDISR